MDPSLSSLWSPISGGITSPRGFKASGIRSNLKPSGNLDLALLLAPNDSICAGTFTQSSIRAACVDLCKNRLHQNNGRVRSVLINSGQANACVGDRGLIDTLKAIEAVAKKLCLTPSEVLMCSTGVIGQPIPMDNLLDGIDNLVEHLNENGGNSAAQAILTTDLIDKQIAFEAFLGDRRVRIGGMAKGSGMIHPNMATMLGYLTCDVGIDSELWHKMIKRVVNSSFNAISVDGDTSTNDTFLAFNAGNSLENKYFEALEVGLLKTSQYLAKSIARDGEGANCLIEVHVEGTRTDDDARHIAKIICSSSLVKTAIHGKDPNWGRILAALGRSRVSFSLQDVSLWIGSYQLIQTGEPIQFERQQVTNYMKKKFSGKYLEEDSVLIRLVVGPGKCQGVAWGCDLSSQYVAINADYTT